MNLALICDDNYINVNIRLIHLTDLSTALYTAELLNVLKEVARKKKFDETTGMFTLDRKYMTERTGLTVEEQYDCETCLIGYGVLTHPDDNLNHMIVDTDAYVQLITDETVKLLTKITKAKSKIKEQEKRAQNKAGMIEGRQLAAEQIYISLYGNNEVLQHAVKDWMESIVLRKGTVTNAAVKITLELLRPYTDESRAEILREATVNGYANLQWVIDKLPKLRSNATLSAPQQTATAADLADVSF